jgi:ABC-type Zn2+ transport system substrate-binding protein/surface adhesin
MTSSSSPQNDHGETEHVHGHGVAADRHAGLDDHGHDHGDHDHDHPGGRKGFLLSIFRPHSHDAADSIDAALESSSEGIRALKISLVVLLATALAQAVVVYFSGSIALLADTIHNFSTAEATTPPPSSPPPDAGSVVAQLAVAGQSQPHLTAGAGDDHHPA